MWFRAVKIQYNFHKKCRYEKKNRRPRCEEIQTTEVQDISGTTENNLVPNSPLQSTQLFF